MELFHVSQSRITEDIFLMQKDVSRSLLQRAFGVISGLAITMSVPFFLSPGQQGYYYTFASVLATQIFFELGLGQVLLYRFSSYAPSELNRDRPTNLKSSSELLYVSRRIYILISILFFVIGSSTGLILFSRFHYSGIQWIPQWLLLVFFTSINLAQSIKFVFLESQGSIARVAVFRLKLNLIASTAFYMCDVWRRQIFPLQWRMSLSWMSGYFIFQLITPIAFIRFGPTVAGQLGFAVSAMNSILFVATTFTSAISPRLSLVFHAGRIDLFNSLFDRSFKRSLGAIIVLTQLCVLFIFLLSKSNVDIVSRFLAWRPLLVYSVSVVFFAVVYCWSIYLRSQAIEPLVLQSTITAIVMVPVIWASSFVSLEAMLASMLSVTIASSIFAWYIYSINRENLLSAFVLSAGYSPDEML